jgi:hypothetical protein
MGALSTEEIDAIMRNHAVRLEYVAVHGVYRALSAHDDGKVGQRAFSSGTLSGCLLALASHSALVAKGA